jgi:predicted ATPase
LCLRLLDVLRIIKMDHNTILRKIYNSIFDNEEKEKVIFVEGEAGIGKTTLIKELIKKIADSGTDCQFAFTECSTPIAGNDIGQFEALSPWIKIFHDLEFYAVDNKQKKKELVANLSYAVLKLIPYVGYFISDTAAAIQKHKKALKKTDQSISGNDQQQMFSIYINFLKNISLNKTLVVIIDDFHWADDSSVNFLFTAARQLKSNRIFFIITYRNEDILSSRSGKGHPLLRIKNELERYSLAKIYNVLNLQEHEFLKLMSDRYQLYKNDEKFEKWLIKISSGNPLFIKLYLQLLEDEGFINDKDFNLKQGYQNIGVPTSANAIINERLRRLDKHHKDLLSYASVEGEYCTSLVAAQLSNLNKLELIKELRTIEEKFQLIKILGSQNYYYSETTLFSFTQFVYQKIFYDNLTCEEKKILHNSAFNIIENEMKFAMKDGFNVENILSRLIVHAEMSGNYFRTVELLYQSALLNWEKFAKGETISQIDKALNLLDEKCNIDKNEIDLWKAKLYQFKSGIEMDCGNISLALDYSEKSIKLYSQFNLSIELIDSLNRKIWTLILMQNYTQAEKTGLFALNLSEKINDMKSIANICNTLGDCYSKQGKYQLALEFLNKSISIKEKLYDKLGIAKSYINSGTVYMGIKDYVKALDYSFKGLNILFEIGTINDLATCYNNIAVCYEDSGDFEKALKYNLLSLELKEKIGNSSSIAKTLINIGDVYLKQNQIKAALDNYEKAYLLLDEIYDRDWLQDLSIEISDLYLKIMDYEKSKLFLDKFHALNK